MKKFAFAFLALLGIATGTLSLASPASAHTYLFPPNINEGN